MGVPKVFFVCARFLNITVVFQVDLRKMAYVQSAYRRQQYSRVRLLFKELYL